MKKVVNRTHAIVSLMMIILLIFAGVNLRDEEYNLREDYGYQEISYENARWVYDESLPCRGKDVVTIRIDELSDFASYLCFFEIHQSVNVYIDNELVYYLKPDEKNLFGKTPGNNWISIPLKPDDINKRIVVEFIPAYSSAAGVIPNFYIGDKWSIYFDTIKGNFLAFALSVLSILIGLAFLCWFFFNKNIPKEQNKLVYLGGFAFWIGVWKVTDLDAISLFFPHVIVVDLLPVVALFMLVVPFTSFLREMFEDKMEILTDGICMVCNIMIFTIIVCQALNLIDFREVLYIDHLLFIGIIIIGTIMFVAEIKKKGVHKEIMTAIICIFSVLLGALVDMVIFYVFQGKVVSSFGMFGFLAYTIVMGVSTMRQSVTLMQKGKEANRYKLIAYKDQLTGLYTRSAFAEVVEAPDFKPENYVVIMCDLNNLKKCNDTYGHEAGDRYIVESTKLIKEAFGKVGSCFRMGGDEFCILADKGTINECENAVGILKRQELEYNKNNRSEFPIHVATGIAIYDALLDEDINATMKRADAMMYADKVNSKANRE